MLLVAMKKHEYIERLRHTLEKHFNTKDTKDILSDIEEHFAISALKGISEEAVTNGFTQKKH